MSPDLPDLSRLGRPRPSPWPAIMLVAVLVALMVATTVKVPYYTISPGGTASVEPLVHVDGGRSYPPKGEIYLVTVAQKRPTIVEALQGWLDPTIDVLPEKAVLPPNVTPSKLQELNLEAMATSKQKAVAVAFEQLGYHVISGNGARVLNVLRKTPAAAFLHKGDVIQAIDGQPTKLDSDAVRLLGSHAPGESVELTYLPKGATAGQQQRVTLTTHPDKPKKAYLGVQLDTYQPRFDLPFKVDIELERVGGPSAGLAFALEVLDALTDGELTGGTRVAATGEIALDGSVLPIGGVAQKALAVEKAGIRLFLVPKGEEKEARKYVGGSLRVEPVRNLRDALRILASLGGNGLALDRAGGA